MALRGEIQKLQGENLKLSKDNLILDEQNLKLQNDVSKLSKELEEQKATRVWEQPLIQIGVAIRRRFWEYTKERRGWGWVDESIVEAGNNAAHQGDIVADTSMLHLGYMTAASLETTSVRCNDTTKRIVRDQFDFLYGTHYELVKGQWGPFRDREREICNVSATVASCCPSYSTASDVPPIGDHNAAEFSRLVGECVRTYSQILALSSSATEAQKDFDADTGVGSKLQEMRGVVARIVKLNFGRKRIRTQN